MKKIFLLMMTFCSFNAFSQIPPNIPTNGLVGWWPFNGNANDESGNGNNGTIVGNTTLAIDRFGNSNSAYSFDGNADYIDCGDSPSVNITGSLTISAWIYSNDLSFPRGIVTKSALPPNGFSYQLVVGPYSLGNLDFLDSDFGYYVSTNNWIHVVSVFDSVAQTVKLYTNGTLFTTMNVGFNSLGISPDNLCLGTHRPGFTPDWSWNGRLDDIAIWNRALSPLEITTIFVGCQTTFATQPINQSVSSGNNAQFSCASADTLTNYQWQTDQGTGFLNLSNAGQYNGATNDTLMVSNTTLSNNNQNFRCIITNGACTDTSDIVTLTVTPTGINVLEIQNCFSVFPNPTNDVIGIQGNTIIYQVKILNILGQEMKLVHADSKKICLSLSDFPDNIYLIEINDAAIPIKISKANY